MQSVRLGYFLKLELHMKRKVQVFTLYDFEDKPDVQISYLLLEDTNNNQKIFSFHFC